MSIFQPIQFIASDDEANLTQHGLNTFEALWELEIPNVDNPNTKRGGWSTVGYVTIGGKGYYLKKQQNYFTRVLRAPWGELRAKHEFRYIQYYMKRDIPTMTVAFFAEKAENGNKKAILLTNELIGWQDLDSFLLQWQSIHEARQTAVLNACAILAKKLHDNKFIHRCFYPKHVFLRSLNDSFETCLIDLEKTRFFLLREYGYLRDLYNFRERTKPYWSTDEFSMFLSAYLQKTPKSPAVQLLFTKVEHYHKK